jgi:aerobic-type carbon monoxide dehydrogenase small subunit (CoxS/CutS family)
MKKNIQFSLNGEKITVNVDGQRTLLWVLRTELELTGTKYGCGEGFCGACTVLLDQEAVRSCQMTMDEVAGKSVVTIEGLSTNGRLHPLQKAFIEHDAQQCGYCTPGMIMSAAGLLAKNPQPSEEQIIQGMDDNLCRCGSYRRIVQAVQSAAEALQKGGGHE